MFCTPFSDEKQEQNQNAIVSGMTRVGNLSSANTAAADGGKDKHIEYLNSDLTYRQTETSKALQTRYFLIYNWKCNRCYLAVLKETNRTRRKYLEITAHRRWPRTTSVDLDRCGVPIDQVYNLKDALKPMGM